MLKNKSPVVFAEYKELRNKVTHEMEAAKRNYFENLVSEAINGNTSETWKVINKLLRQQKRKTTAIPQSIEIGKKSIKSPESIYNKMNEHFVTIGEKLSAKVKSSQQLKKVSKSF